MTTERILVGVIVGVHGVHGRVRIKSFTAEPADVGAYGPLVDEAGTRTFTLSVSGAGRGVVMAAITGINDRTAAEALKGTRLYVARSALPSATAEDEFYYADLIGLRVILDDGSAVGRVEAVHDYGAGAMLEVRPDDDGRRTVMVPFTRDAVPGVDLAGGQVTVARASGVFDSAYVAGRPVPGETVEGDIIGTGDNAPGDAAGATEGDAPLPPPPDTEAPTPGQDSADPEDGQEPPSPAPRRVPGRRPGRRRSESSVPRRRG